MTENINTCPMHPRIRQMAPSPCRISGMTLEPMKGNVEHTLSRELANITRRSWFVLVAALHVLVTGLGKGTTFQFASCRQVEAVLA